MFTIAVLKFPLAALKIASVSSPTVAGVALDVIGWKVVLLFHHTKYGDFSIYHWSAERATLAALQ